MDGKVTEGKVTLHRVAQRAGVSRATASMILNNNAADRFMEETQRKVRQAAQELNYEPRARQAAPPESRRMLTWLHPRPLSRMDRRHTYDGEILDSIIEAAHEHGWHVAVSNGIANVDDMHAYLERMGKDSSDALMLAGDLDPQVLACAASSGLPAVYVCHSANKFDGIHGVYADNFQGGTLAAAHLLDLGHQRFMVVGRRSRSYIRQRIAGFNDELAHRGLGEENIVLCDPESGDFDTIMDQATARTPTATAVFIASGDDTMLTFAWIKRRAIRVPQTLSIVGYDDWPENTLVTPPLTTVANARKPLGQIAFRRLMELSRHPDTPPAGLMVPTNLITRESTGPVTPDTSDTPGALVTRGTPVTLGSGE